MAVSSGDCNLFFSSPAAFDCRHGYPSGTFPRKPAGAKPSAAAAAGVRSFFGLSSALRFTPNFVCQLRTKGRRNCSNMGDSFDASAASAAANPIGPATFTDDWTLAVHAGERFGRRGITTDGITTPVFNTSTYSFKNSDELTDFREGRHESYAYGRYGNPTTKVLEDKISALESAESTLCVASGMLAIAVTLKALLRAGGHVIMTPDCYRRTGNFIRNELPRMGILVSVVDFDVKALEKALGQNKVSLYFTESPTNPFLRCVDVESVSKLCRSKRVLVCIDSTFASPINQKALTLGADLVLHSMTKFLGGHNDVLGGCISGSEKLISRIRRYHHASGGIINPEAAFLFIRGMKTLHLRVQAQNSTALRMAQILEEHPKIIRVYYPGLQSHPDNDIAKRQMTGFGGVVSFEVEGDLRTTAKFIDSLKIPYIASSFGGCESLVSQPATLSYGDLKPSGRAMHGIKDNLVRFSFGVEAFEDLKNDILQALEMI